MNKTKADNLPESWIKITLSKILSENLQPGFAQNPKDGGDVGQIRTHNVSPDGSIDLNGLKFVFPSEKEFKKYTLRKGDIVFNNTNSDEWVGKTALYELEEEYLFSNHMTRIRVNTSLAEPEYIAKYLHFLWARGFSRSKSKQWVNQSGIEQSILASFPIPLPPLAEQKQIVAILQEADALRRKKKEILEKSNRLASALFLEMFGDPVRNEMGWDLRKIADVTVKVQTDDPTKYKGINYNYFDISSIDNNSKKIIDYKNIISEEAPSRARQIIKEHDILISTVRPNLNSVAMIKIKYKNPIASTGFCILRSKKEVNKDYLFQICKINSFVEYLVNKTRGANYPAVSDKDIKELKIALPPLPLQNDFAKKIEAIEDTTKQIESSLQKMEKLYDSLLQKAFTGDLTESWRKRNPDVKDNNVKSKKIQLQAFEFKQPNIKEDVIKEETPPSQSSPRLWLKKQLSEEQKLVLDKWRNWGNFPITPQTSGFKDIIEEVVYEGQGMKAEEKKEIVIRILNQLVGIGFAEKISVQTSEYGYITGYRYLGEKDRSKTKDSDISLLKSKKAE